MRDKPSFDDLEPPVVITTPIDGMTDEEWAARRERNERRWRIAFGVLLGALVGLFASLRTSFSGSLLATALVVAASIAIFAGLFAQQRHDVLDEAAWLLFPEWHFVEKLPLWVLVAVWVAGVALAIILAAALLVGLLAS